MDRWEGWGVWAWGLGPPRKRAFEQALPRQVDVIKKAYLQEEERENSEVSPREVGHNIYILALQVPAPPFPSPPLPPRPCPHDHASVMGTASLSSPGTTNSCSTC